MAFRVLALSAQTVLDAARGCGSQERNNARLQRWAERVIAQTATSVVVVGREHLRPGQVYVIMSNHLSHYDIPVLFYALGPNIRMVAKKELFAIPLFGRAMREAGFVEVDRKNRTRAVAALQGAASLLNEGTHLWIAPEGTRSPTGQLLPFKKGGFALAIDAALPILPVTLWGTRDILRPHERGSRKRANVQVTIHSPVATGSPPADSPGRKAYRDEILQRVRDRISGALPANSGEPA